MALKVHSLFYYGHVIDDSNNFICFKDGVSDEKVAEIPVGAYTMTKFLEVITASLNAASSLDWTYAVNRSTRIVTFTSSGPASLLFGTGTLAINSPAALLGFPAADILSATSFVGSEASGYVYAPQFPLQNYIGPRSNKGLVNAVVNKSASGDAVQIQRFGTVRMIKMNIKWITNQPSDGTLRNNPDAVDEALAFMDYIVEKNALEFMEDETDPDTFDRVRLESTGTNADGTSYELLEYYDRGLPEFFETGLLTFKLINIE